MKSMMWLVVTKDLRRLRGVLWLWFLALAVTSVAGAFVSVLADQPGWKMLAQTLWMLQPLAQMVLVALLVPLLLHEDPLVDARAFWLTRPISRRTLLAAKAVFLALVVVLPALVGELLAMVCNGLSARQLLCATPEILLAMLSKVCVLGALAALTRNFGQFAIALVSYLFAYGVLSFGIGIWLSTTLATHSDGETTMMETGYLQTQALVGWLSLSVVGSALMVWQFLTRRTRPAIVAGVAGLVAMMVVKGLCAFNAFDGPRSNPAEKPDNLSVTLQDLRPTADLDLIGFRSRIMEATLFVKGVPNTQFRRIPSGRVSLRYPDTGDLQGNIISGEGIEAGRFGQDLARKGKTMAAATQALTAQFGEIHVINGPTGTVQTVDGEAVRIVFNKSSARFDSLIGQSGIVSGVVTVALSGYRIGAITRTVADALLVNGADRDRIAAITTNASGLLISILKTRATIALDGETSNQDMYERMMMQSQAAYALINLACSNEVVMCEKSEPDDMISMMTMATRISLPPRLDFTSVKLLFPPVSAAWLKDAELVCLQTKQLGQWETPLAEANVVLQAAQARTEKPHVSH
jgi:hypothetical protein